VAEKSSGARIGQPVRRKEDLRLVTAGAIRSLQGGAGTLTGGYGIGVTQLLAPVQAQCATLIAPYRQM